MGCGHEAKLDVGAKAARDQEAVEKLVEGIAAHDIRPCAVVLCAGCDSCASHWSVAMAATAQLFAHEKTAGCRRVGWRQVRGGSGNLESMGQDVRNTAPSRHRTALTDQHWHMRGATR